MTTRAKRHCSDALAAVHETASDLHASGLLNEQTMRTFDDQEESATGGGELMRSGYVCGCRASACFHVVVALPSMS